MPLPPPARYNLEGDGCTDFLITWCCAPCAMCQEHRELNVRGMGPGALLRDTTMVGVRQAVHGLQPALVRPNDPSVHDPSGAGVPTSTPAEWAG